MLFVLAFPFLALADAWRRWRDRRRHLAECEPLVADHASWWNEHRGPPPTAAELAAGTALDPGVALTGASLTFYDDPPGPPPVEREALRAGEIELGGRVVAPDRPHVVLALDQAAPFAVDRDVYEAAFDAVVGHGGVRVERDGVVVVLDFRGDRFGSPNGLPMIYVCPRCGALLERIEVPDLADAGKPRDQWPTIPGSCTNEACRYPMPRPEPRRVW